MRIRPLAIRQPGWGRKVLLAAGLSCLAVALLVVVEGAALRLRGRDPFTRGMHASVVEFHTLHGRGPGLSLVWTRQDELIAENQYFLGLHDLPLKRACRSICLSGITPCCVAWTGEEQKIVVGSFDGGLYTWDVTAPQQHPQKLGEHAESAAILTCTPDGQWLVAASNNLLSVWDLKERELCWQREDCLCTCIALHPHSASIICGTSHGEVLELDFFTGRTLHLLAKHFAAVMSVAVSADGTRTASIGTEGRLVMTEWASDMTLWSVQHSHIGPLCFSPAGELLVSAGSEGNVWRLLIWDAKTGRRQAQLAGHTNAILGVTFTDDGRLYSWGVDGTIRAWDLDRLTAVGLFSPTMPTCAG